MKKNLTFLLVLPCLMFIACHDIHKSNQPDGCTDEDGDGYCSIPSGGQDCNDDDPDIHPGAEEICGDKIDQNCNGTDLDCDCVDEDGDEFCDDEDCDDEDPDINPDVPEICDNGIDDDCDGLVDEADDDCMDCTDADRDGFCSEETGGTDCDDLRSLVNPDADEICDNGRDDDCDGLTDGDDPDCGGSCDDCDGDGYDSEASGGSDCNDSNANVHPGRAEICDNGIDDDCDGDVDGDDSECETGCTDFDGDGYCSEATGGSDCNDSNASVHPGRVEDCDNGIDDDCDGLIDGDDLDCGGTGPGDLHSYRIRVYTSGMSFEDVAVTGSLCVPGRACTYHSSSSGLTDESGSSCYMNTSRGSAYTSYDCVLRLPQNTAFYDINVWMRLTDDGEVWGCYWPGGTSTDTLLSYLSWTIELPSGHVDGSTISSSSSSHGPNDPHTGCDWLPMP